MGFKSFTIENDLTNQSTGAIEVIVEMDDGQRRWCFFMTPEAMRACGDWIDGTTTRIHYGSPHRIVVACVLDAEVIERALRHIDRAGQLEACTMALDSDTKLWELWEGTKRPTVEP